LQNPVSFEEALEKPANGPVFPFTSKEYLYKCLQRVKKNLIVYGSSVIWNGTGKRLTKKEESVTPPGKKTAGVPGAVKNCDQKNIFYVKNV
jgi:hypothetical protein